MASVTYGKCIMVSVIIASVIMANETEPLDQKLLRRNVT